MANYMFVKNSKYMLSESGKFLAMLLDNAKERASLRHKKWKASPTESTQRLHANPGWTLVPGRPWLLRLKFSSSKVGLRSNNCALQHDILVLCWRWQYQRHNAFAHLVDHATALNCRSETMRFLRFANSAAVSFETGLHALCT